MKTRIKAVGERCLQVLNLSESKQPVVNQQCLVYQFKDLYDTSNVGFTRRHSHQPGEEYKNSSSPIGLHFTHFRVKHSLGDLVKSFIILSKCENTFHTFPGKAFLRGSCQEFYNFE